VDFEYDANKSSLNKTKHGIDLVDTQKLWLDPDIVVGPGDSTTEPRWLAVGEIEGVAWTACFTYRGEKIRIIQCRRARDEERKIYELSK
jgi:uncharacterized DUF497 family protein